MRRACNETAFVFADDGTLEGVALGFDFVAEHELGVREIRLAFGVGEAGDKGVESRRVTIVPEGLSFYMSRDLAEALLSYSPTNFSFREPCQASSLRKDSELRFYDSYPEPRPEDDIVAAWGSEDFGIHVRGTENVKSLKAIYDAFRRKEIVVGLKPADYWLGSGLIFVLRSAFTEENEAKILALDEAKERLEKAVEATGIKDTLREAKCSYFALVPRWANDDETEISFWLNPMGQNKNNYGHFKIPDLEAWARGEGPIPKVS